MNFKNFLTSFVIVFVITLIVSILVTFLYSFAFHETANIDWETSFRLAIILGIIFPVIEAKKGKSEVK